MSFAIGLALCIWAQSDAGMDMQGHRGARGLAPENTWPAFVLALEHGMTTLELDTNLSRDDQLIICHDTSVNKALCLGKDGEIPQEHPIRNLSVAQLKELDCGRLKNALFPEQKPVPGTRLLTLAELFDKVSAYEKNQPKQRLVNFNVELKVPEWLSEDDLDLAASAMIATVEKAAMTDRTTIQCFDPRFLERMLARKPNLKRAILFGFPALLADMLTAAKGVKAQIISPHFGHVDATFVATCHDAGYQVIPWTINDPEMMTKLVALGVDGMISDYPNRLASIQQTEQK